jgi:hypothetical protein
MEIKEIKIGQIVFIDYDSVTLYKVLEINGGKATLGKVSKPDEQIIANIANLSLVINS